MPLVKVKGEFGLGDVDKEKQVFAKYPLLPNEKIADIPARELAGKYALCVPVSAASADVVRWTAAGKSRVARVDDKLRMEKAEMVFLQNKYPGLIEVIREEEADTDPNEDDVAIVLDRQRLQDQVSVLTAKLAAKDDEARNQKILLDDAQRSAASAIAKQKADADTIRELSLKLDDAQKTIVRLTGELHDAKSPVKGTPSKPAPTQEEELAAAEKADKKAKADKKD